MTDFFRRSVLTGKGRNVLQKVHGKVACFCITLLLLVAPSSAPASGFRITNQSLGAVGLAGAHIAFTPGPDSAYYNPANMSFLGDQRQMESSLTLLALPAIKYTDNRGPLFNGSSESELFFMPLLHAVSSRFGNLRFGFSLTYPYGLSKEWQQPFPKASTEQFSLFVVEGNPTVAYAPTDWWSLGGGIRVLYGKGEVQSEVVNAPYMLSRSLEGTDTRLGYNLALAIRPRASWTIAATYRSEVELDLAGNSLLQSWGGTPPVEPYAGSAHIAIPLPAVFSLATSYTIDRLTVELGWDRTYWSSFKALDFVYSQDFLGTVFDGFDRVIFKNWHDTDAFRLGLSYDWNERWTTTLGFAYDRTPVPVSTLGFELPDSDALVYSAGVRYRFSSSVEGGLSYMYHRTRNRSVTNDGVAGLPGIDGSFTEGGAHAVTIGVIAGF